MFGRDRLRRFTNGQLGAGHSQQGKPHLSQELPHAPQPRQSMSKWHFSRILEKDFNPVFQLDLCHNRLSKGLENLKQCTKLKCLILAGNRFKPSKDLEFLEPLVSQKFRNRTTESIYLSSRRLYQILHILNSGRSISMTMTRSSTPTK